MSDPYRPPETHDPRPPRRPVSTRMWVIVIAGGALVLLMYCGMILVPVGIPVLMREGDRTHQREAETMLAAIATAQARHHELHGEYAVTFAALSWQPPEAHRYSYFLQQDAIQSEEGPFAVPTQAQNVPSGGFTAYAVGNIDGDPDLDVWRVGPGSDPEHVSDDVELW